MSSQNYSELVEAVEKLKKKSNMQIHRLNAIEDELDNIGYELHEITKLLKRIVEEKEST